MAARWAAIAGGVNLATGTIEDDTHVLTFTSLSEALRNGLRNGTIMTIGGQHALPIPLFGEPGDHLTLWRLPAGEYGDTAQARLDVLRAATWPDPPEPDYLMEIGPRGGIRNEVVF